jgi:hypothetical protein
MTDVPGQQPLFNAPLPEPGNIEPGTAKERPVEKKRRSRARPGIKKGAKVCNCPKCGWQFLVIC